MTDKENRTFSDKFMLRLPDGLRDRIKVAADRNGRSMNAEIVQLLEHEYPGPPISDIDYYSAALKVTLNRLNVEPPEGMTIDDVVRVAATDLMLDMADLADLADKLRQDAIERQAQKDAMEDD